MTPRSFSDEGIVLARRSFGEADRILSVFSKHHGRLALIAKGVRKPESRKRGHLEIFSQIKFQASRGRSLDIITEVETLDPFLPIRKNLKRVALAYYFMEVVGRTTREGEKNEELYSHILKNLGILKSEIQLKILKNNFVSELLAILGFWPKGRPLENPDAKLSEVIERTLSTVRVGRKLVN